MVVSLRTNNNRYGPPPAPPRPVKKLDALTTRFNELVVQAKAAGCCPSWARVHTSDFASRDVARRKIAELEEAMR